MSTANGLVPCVGFKPTEPANPWTGYTPADPPEVRAAGEARIIGSVFGALRIIRREDGGLGEANAKWRAWCECGTVITASTQELRYGGVRHCGCGYTKPSPKPPVWTFPRVLGSDGKPVSPVWAAALGRTAAQAQIA
jgi:hypothetical protein